MKVNKNNLFPTGNHAGAAQTPYMYDRNHSLLLNFITICNIPELDNQYEINDDAFSKFKEGVNIQLGHLACEAGVNAPHLVELCAQRKETMNDIVTGTTEVVTTDATVPAEAVVAIAVDPVTGEPVEIKSEEVGTVTSEGEVGEVTVH